MRWTVEYLPDRAAHPVIYVKYTETAARAFLAGLVAEPKLRWVRVTEHGPKGQTVLYEQGEPPR